MRPFFLLVIANIKEFLRNKTFAIITLLVPVFFVAFFGMAFGGMTNGKFSVGLVVEDSSTLGDGMSQAFEKITVFDISRGSRESEMDALNKGKVRAVIVVPEGAGASIASGKVNLSVYYDNSQSVAAQTILTVLRQVVDEMDKQITGRPTIMTLEAIPSQTSRLRDIDFLLPGILAMGLMWLGIFSAIPLVTQRENLTLKRYNATPLSKSKLVAAQVTSKLLISVLQAVIILGVGKLLFNVQNVGSWFLLGAIVIIGTLLFVSMGYVIAAIARTEEAANGMSQLLNFPLMFLSGAFFPIEMMPSYLTPVIRAMPLTYLNDAFRQIMLTGASLSALWIDIGVMVGWIVVCLGISVRFFRWT